MSPQQNKDTFDVSHADDCDMPDTCIRVRCDDHGDEFWNCRMGDMTMLGNCHRYFVLPCGHVKKIDNKSGVHDEGCRCPK